MKKKALFSVLLLSIILIAPILFLLRNPTKQRITPEKIPAFLSSLSPKEIFELDYFFRCLIQEEQIGYVLLGEKPMSFHSYFLPKTSITQASSLPSINLELFFESFNQNDILFHLGFETWKKYQHLFCGKNIFFDFIETNAELRWAKIVVINNKLLKQIFAQQIDQFNLNQFSNKEKTAEDLVNELLNNKRYKEKFYSQHHLLGIALGYGEKNARLFDEMSSITTSITKTIIPLKRLSLEHKEKLKEKLTKLNSKLEFFNDQNSRKFLFTQGSGFRADFSDTETLRLQNKYKQARKSLTQQYSSKGFLQKTLELIIYADQNSTRRTL